MCVEDKISKQRLELICKSEIFAGVDEIIVEGIITDNRCTLQQIPKGDRLCGGDGVGIVLAGRIQMEKPLPDGKYMKISFLQPGACFGRSQSVESGGTWLTAARNTEVLCLPEAVLRWAMQRNFTITENYIRYLTDQIHMLYEKLSDLTGGTAKQRLAVFLDANCDAEGVLRTTMTDLSRQLNVGRATIYRALGALEEQRLIRTGGKTIQVMDRQTLRRIVNSTGL